MLEPDIVLVKTDAGREAVERRTPPLAVRQRTILISINGSLSVAALCTRFGSGPGDAQVLELLEGLTSLGLVQAQQAAKAPAAPAPASVRPAASPPQPTRPDWRVMRERASALLHDLLGDQADMLVQRLARSGSEAELSAGLERAFDLIEQHRGGDHLKRYKSQLLAS